MPKPVNVTEDIVPLGELERLSYHGRFVTDVEAGLADAEAGRVVTSEELRKQIERELEP